MLRNISDALSSIFIRPISLRGIITAAVLATLTAALPRPAAAGLGFSEPKALNSNALTGSRNDFTVDIATNRTGRWIALWHGYENIDGETGHDGDILMTMSENNGTTWTEVAPLNITAITGNGPELLPRLESDEAGVWMAVWQGYETPSGAVGMDSDTLFSRSVDDGLTWTPTLPIHSNAGADTGDDFSPLVRCGGGGVWVAAWSSEEDLFGTAGTEYDVLFVRTEDDGATWTDPALLNHFGTTDSGVDWSPDLACDWSGNWIAVWGSQENLNGIGTDYDILYSVSADNGVTWSDSAPLDSNAAINTGQDGLISGSLATYGPRIATDRAGSWMVTWASNDTFGDSLGDDADIMFSLSQDAGQTWSAPAPVNTNAAVDPEGTAGLDNNPTITTDRNGTWVVVWETVAYSAPTFGDLDVAVARSTDLGETWSVISPLNLNSITDTGGRDNDPVTATDGTGHWVCVWTTGQPYFAGSGDFDLLVATSGDITQPPGPDVLPGLEDVFDVLVAALSGLLILDQNGDGEIDAADLILTLAQIQN